MSKKVSVIVAIVLATTFGLGYSPVSAYPPGVPLAAALSQDMITFKTGKTTLTLNNVKPSSPVSVTFRGKSTEYTADTNGQVTQTYTGVPSGIYIFSVSQTYTFKPGQQPTTESASLNLYVPKVTVPKSIKIKSKTKVPFKFCKPGSVITLTAKNGTKVLKKFKVKLGKKATATTITIPAKLFRKGKKNAIFITVGPFTKLKFTIVGK